MDYTKLMDYLSEIGENSLDTKSPQMLKKYIENKKYEFLSAFSESSWTFENIKLLIDTASDESNVYILNDLRLYILSKEQKRELVSLLIKKNFTNVLIDNFSNDIYNDNQFVEEIISNIKTMDISCQKLSKILIINKQKDEILSALLKEKRYDLVAFLLETSAFDDKNGHLLNGHMDKIIKYIRSFNINFSNSYSIVKKNNQLFEEIFLNGYYEILQAVIYYDSDDLKKYVNSNQLIINKMLEYIKIADESYVMTCVKYTIAKNSPKFLNAILNRKNGIYGIDQFENSAWTIENQILYYNLKSQNKEIVGSISYYNLAYLNYKYNYNFNTPWLRGGTYSDIKSNASFTNFQICYQIGKDVSENKIQDDSVLTKFYKFIYETKSENIHRLALALTESNIDNLEKIYDENGITDYFKKHLLYDPNYIYYRGIGICDEIKDTEHRTYVEILLIDKNIAYYMHYLNMNESNLHKYFNGTSVTRELIEKLYTIKGIKILEILYQNNYPLNLNEFEENVLKKCIMIESNSQRETFVNYCLSHKDECNSTEMIDRIYNLIGKIKNSNSYEIRAKSDNILKYLVTRDNYIEVFNELEEVLISGSAPEFMKRFIIYKVIYGDREITKDYQITSPILKSSTREEADKIILADLFRISLATNSRDIKNYINKIKMGEKVYSSYDKNNSNHDSEELRIMHEYRIILEFLAKYLMKIEYETSTDDYSTIYNIEVSYHKSKGFNIPIGFRMPMVFDAVFKNISSEFWSFIQLEMYMAKHDIIRTLFEERKILCNESLTIKKGDFIKGIDSQYLDNIFSFGSISKEFLGESASEDGTHLDTDMSYIPKDMATISELFRTNLTGCTFGDMSLIISDDYIRTFDEYIVTKKHEGEKTEKEFTDNDKKKTEIFCHSSSDNHYCIRTGFPITYVKAIIASRNFDRARFIVLKNDFFVPIYDRNGKLIFSFEDYQREKHAMDGLSYYERKEYAISQNLETPETTEILKELNGSVEDTNNKRAIIQKELSKVISKYFGKTKYYINSAVEKDTIEIIDTGSTGRGTNLLGDGDFDFIIRLDTEFLNSDKLKQFTDDIYKLFHKPAGDSQRIRLNDVKIDGIDKPIQLELTVIDKNNKVEYSSDMCVNDRLNTIQRQYPNEYPYVVANIVYAKKIFKSLGIYKNFDGGFGGIGVENWILQHGGSFYDAVQSFVETAKQCKDLDEFKQKYHIYDFGKNHYTYAKTYKNVSFPYDNYVNNLKDKSYKTMLSKFEEYLALEQKNNNHKL